ncbi:MAG TPA: hypothetical protein VI248_14080, partial [Kineosporiaceae bacterium]
TDTTSWSAVLRDAMTAVTGDDASMALLGVGADHAGFRRLFAARTAQLEQESIHPLDDLAAEIEQARRALEDLERRRSSTEKRLWGRYKPGYERYLHAGRETR